MKRSINVFMAYIFCTIFLNVNAGGALKAISKVSFQEARLIAVKAFNLKTGDKFKVFRCSLVEETAEDWMFVFDEYENPPPPGGEIFVFVNKRNGKTKMLIGK